MATFVSFLKSGGANQKTDVASGDLVGLQADVARVFGEQMARFGNSGVGFHELSIEDQTTRAEMAVAALETIAGVEAGSLVSTSAKFPTSKAHISVVLGVDDTPSIQEADARDGPVVGDLHAWAVRATACA